MRIERFEFRSDTRGYIMVLEPDLFGTPILSRYWFSLSSRRGGYKRQSFLDEDAARKELRRVEQIRLRRGYRRLETGKP
jgi:predicted DNA-binding WGR domain protein